MKKGSKIVVALVIVSLLIIGTIVGYLYFNEEDGEIKSDSELSFQISLEKDRIQVGDYINVTLTLRNNGETDINVYDLVPLSCFNIYVVTPDNELMYYYPIISSIASSIITLKSNEEIRREENINYPAVWLLNSTDMVNGERYKLNETGEYELYAIYSPSNEKYGIIKESNEEKTNQVTVWDGSKTSNKISFEIYFRT